MAASTRSESDAAAKQERSGQEAGDEGMADPGNEGMADLVREESQASLGSIREKSNGKHTAALECTVINNSPAAQHTVIEPGKPSPDLRQTSEKRFSDAQEKADGIQGMDAMELNTLNDGPAEHNPQVSSDQSSPPAVRGTPVVDLPSKMSAPRTRSCTARRKAFAQARSRYLFSSLLHQAHICHLLSLTQKHRL